MISVIIPTKNGGSYLQRAIASVEKQIGAVFEIIVISDGSTDNTVETARRLASNIKSMRVIELADNIGPGLARDKAIRESAGEFIALLDNDDEWISGEKLSVQLKFLNENKDYTIVGSLEAELVKTDAVTHESPIIYRTTADDADIRKHCLQRNQFITSSMMFRRSDYIQVGGFSDLRQGEDYELNLRLLRIGKGANLDHCIIRYYISETGAHRSNKKGMNLSVLSTIKKNKRNFPNYYLGLLKAYLRLLLNR